MIYTTDGSLGGRRTFAVYAGLYAIGRFWTKGMQLSYSPYQFGLRVDQVVMVLALIGAAAYLYLTRHRPRPDFICSRPTTTRVRSRVSVPVPGLTATLRRAGPEVVLAERAGVLTTPRPVIRIGLPTAPMIRAGSGAMRSASVPPLSRRQLRRLSTSGRRTRRAWPRLARATKMDVRLRESPGHAEPVQRFAAQPVNVQRTCSQRDTADTHTSDPRP